MSNENEKNSIRIDITPKQDEQQTPTNDPKVEKTELGGQELEERVAPLML